MKLTKIHITEFQSILDSTECQIGDVTCLVGKNEAGKTALLKALYRLNPIVKEDGDFDVVLDYPRRSVSDYEDDVKAKRREPAQVVQATYLLEPDDINAIKEVFGSECLKDQTPTVTLSKGYANKRTFSGLDMDSQAALKHLVEAADLPPSINDQVRELQTAKEILEVLSKTDQTEAVQNLIPTLQKISEHGICYVAYNSLLHDRIPKFLYFDEYYQMTGQDNIDALKNRHANSNLEDSDHPLLGLIELAGLHLDQLTDPHRTETLISRLEAAENRLTDKVLTYWSQNRHLRMKFDIRLGQPKDPEGMTSGMNIWGRVHDTKHMVSTALGTRSADSFGFSLFSPGIRNSVKKGRPLSCFWMSQVCLFMRRPRLIFFTTSRRNLSPITSLFTQPIHHSWLTRCISNVSGLSRTKA